MHNDLQCGSAVTAFLDGLALDPKILADYLAHRSPYDSISRLVSDYYRTHINDFGIYLHDTLAKRFFDYHNRAYSHGCVRMSRPDMLAA